MCHRSIRLGSLHLCACDSWWERWTVNLKAISWMSSDQVYPSANVQPWYRLKTTPCPFFILLIYSFCVAVLKTASSYKVSWPFGPYCFSFKWIRWIIAFWQRRHCRGSLRESDAGPVKGIGGAPGCRRRRRGLRYGVCPLVSADDSRVLQRPEECLCAECTQPESAEVAIINGSTLHGVPYAVCSRSIYSRTTSEVSVFSHAFSCCPLGSGCISCRVFILNPK